MAHFELAAGRTSLAVEHRTVEELWYVVAGCAEMWRAQGGREEIVRLEPGCSLSIPLGTLWAARARWPRSVGHRMRPTKRQERLAPIRA